MPQANENPVDTLAFIALATTALAGVWWLVSSKDKDDKAKSEKPSSSKETSTVAAPSIDQTSIRALIEDFITSESSNEIVILDSSAYSVDPAQTYYAVNKYTFKQNVQKLPDMIPPTTIEQLIALGDQGYIGSAGAYKLAVQPTDLLVDVHLSVVGPTGSEPAIEDRITFLVRKGAIVQTEGTIFTRDQLLSFAASIEAVPVSPAEITEPEEITLEAKAKLKSRTANALKQYFLSGLRKYQKDLASSQVNVSITTLSVRSVSKSGNLLSGSDTVTSQPGDKILSVQYSLILRKPITSEQYLDFLSDSSLDVADQTNSISFLRQDFLLAPQGTQALTYLSSKNGKLLKGKSKAKRKSKKNPLTDKQSTWLPYLVPAGVFFLVNKYSTDNKLIPVGAAVASYYLLTQE